jgi:hypothetical protein
MKNLVLPLLALAATACAQQQPAPAAGSSARAMCDPAAVQYAVGQQRTDALVAEVLQRSGARTARVLRPNEVVTQEYNFARVNRVVDANDKVTAVRCG